MSLDPPVRDLAELDRPELEAALEGLGYERFRARQLYQWIYHRGVTDLSAMTDLPRAMRERLAGEFTISTPAIAHRDESVDGTEKFLLRLA